MKLKPGVSIRAKNHKKYTGEIPDDLLDDKSKQLLSGNSGKKFKTKEPKVEEKKEKVEENK